MADLLREQANLPGQEILKTVLDLTDTFPKIFNTVDVAMSRLCEAVEIEVVGTVTSISVAQPVGITANDYKIHRNGQLEGRVYTQFTMAYKSFTLTCVIHNVQGLQDFPCEHINADYSNLVQRIQYAFENGRKVTVVGMPVTFKAKRDMVRVLYVRSINIEADALTSQLTDGDDKSQVGRFLAACANSGTTPLKVFMSEVFTNFAADDYLMKIVAVFCLSPKSRAEMFHVLLLTSPGEGKDYLIDKIIRLTVSCGKVEGNTATTAASLVGAMSANDLSSVGIGLLSRFNNERIAVSEVQTWEESKFSTLLGAMANGEISLAKGNMQIQRPACTNILMAGNIDNSWKADSNPMDKLNSVFGGKNRNVAKQLMSRITVIIAQPQLTTKSSEEKAALMFGNIDKDSKAREGNIFTNDDDIKRICTDTTITPVEKSERIRERKQWLLEHRAGMPADQILSMFRQAAFQEFFGQYFKAVSLRPMDVQPVGPVIYNTLTRLADQEAFKKMLCTVTGTLDNRKIQEFSNLCKCFARIQGHDRIEPDDIHEAEAMMKKSISTMIEDFGADFLTTDLDIVVLDILKFIGENPGCTEDAVKVHLKHENSLDRFYSKYMEAIRSYTIQSSEGRMTIIPDKIPQGLLKDLGISGASIVERDSQMRGETGVADDDSKWANIAESLEGDT